MSGPYPSIPLLIKLRDGLQKMGEVLGEWKNAEEGLCRPLDNSGNVDMYTVERPN